MPTHREVTINGGVKIDGLKELGDNYKTTHKDDARHDTRNFALAIISTVLIAIYAGFTLWQVCLTRQIIAEGGVQAHRDLRPYIYSEKMDVLGSIDNGEWMGQVEVINTGKTPGTKVEGCADFAFRPKDRPMTDDLVCPNPENPATEKPTTGEKSRFVLGSSRPFNLYTSGFSMKVTQQAVAPPYSPDIPFGKVLATGGFYLYIYGEITYTDLIDDPTKHRTYFCGRYNPTTKLFEVCEKHNSMN